MKKRLEEVKKTFLWGPMLIALAVIILDQITKLWTLSASGDTPGVTLYEVIPQYFNFVDYRNTGAAWGMFAGNPRLLSMVSLIAFIYFIFDFPNLTEKIPFRCFAWALLIGGVFGNFIDRFFRLEVIDMIEVYIPLPGNNYRFPAFNIADAGICVGVSLYLFHVIFFSKKKNGEDENPEAEKGTQTQ